MTTYASVTLNDINSHSKGRTSSYTKGPLVIRFVRRRTSYHVLFLPLPSSLPLPPPFQERHENIYESFLPLI